MDKIGACLYKTQDQPPDLKEASSILKWCYHHTLARQPKPSRADLANVSGEYVVIYQLEYQSPLGRSIPIHVAPFQIEDGLQLDMELEA